MYTGPEFGLPTTVGAYAFGRCQANQNAEIVTKVRPSVTLSILDASTDSYLSSSKLA